ncbi:MAG: molybdopterin-guanine dinucleotide biosynthesis protein B [Candidatus Ranarchaeia archaeon]
MIFPYVLCVVANHSKTGKTTLIEQLLKKFNKKGIRVSSIKHIGGDHLQESLEKDSMKHLSAGSEIVGTVDSKTISLRYKKDKGPEQLHSVMSSLISISTQPLPHIILIEGFKQSEYPKIFLIRDSNDLKKLPQGDILFSSSIDPKKAFTNSESLNIEYIEMNEIEKMMDFIIKKGIEFTENNLPQLNCGDCGYGTCKQFAQVYWSNPSDNLVCSSLEGKIKLEVNGKVIPMKGFVQKIITQGVIGMVTALKGVPHPNDLKLSIKS